MDLLGIVLSYHNYLLKEGGSALLIASMYGHTATVIVLLEYGAQVNLFSGVRVYQCELY